MVAVPTDLTGLTLEDNSGVVDEEDKAVERSATLVKELDERATLVKGLEERTELVKGLEERTVVVKGLKD